MIVSRFSEENCMGKQERFGECECGEIMKLTSFTNRCECGRQYNVCGQELGPMIKRDLETGEDPIDSK
jgi:hypothetical protein